MEFFKTDIKIVLFFLLTVFIFFNAAIEPFIIQDMHILEFEHNDPMFLQIYTTSILMAFIALCAVSIVDIKGLKLIDWVVATIFGTVVLSPMLIQATSANISIAVATFFTYLASVTMRNQYGNRMPMIISTKFCDLAVDISIVAVLIWIIIDWSAVGHSFSVNNVILWPLAAAVSEEVVFRLFLFFVIVKLSMDNKPPFFITLLILVIPFSIWHVIGVSIQYGLFYGLGNVYGTILTAIVLSILALKRGLYTAILLHFLINSIQETIAIS